MIANSLRNIMPKLTLEKKTESTSLNHLPWKCPVIAVLHKLSQKVEKKGEGVPWWPSG